MFFFRKNNLGFIKKVLAIVFVKHAIPFQLEQVATLILKTKQSRA